MLNFMINLLCQLDTHFQTTSLFHIDSFSFKQVFWENHNPTQGYRQNNDSGTQYRSAIYTYGDDQLKTAQQSKEVYQKALTEKGFNAITTEIAPAQEFYYAEDYHQQYLDKNPDGYCGLGGTGVSCPRGLGYGAREDL